MNTGFRSFLSSTWANFVDDNLAHVDDPLLLWNNSKEVLRGHIISYTAGTAKTWRKKYHTLLNAMATTQQPIPLERGVRQCCPLSPLLLNLALDPFLRILNLTPRLTGIKIGQTVLKTVAFADDVMLFVDNPSKEWSQIVDITDNFAFSTSDADWNNPLDDLINRAKSRRLHLKHVQQSLRINIDYATVPLRPQKWSTQNDTLHRTKQLFMTWNRYIDSLPLDTKTLIKQTFQNTPWYMGQLLQGDHCDLRSAFLNMKNCCLSRHLTSVMLYIDVFSMFITVAYLGSNGVVKDDFLSDCGPPPRLVEGALKDEYTNKESFSIGSNVQYACQLGYIRIPGSSNMLYCLENSQWSPVPNTFCKLRSCGTPRDIVNGYFEVSDLLFGSKLIYHCNRGYRMISKHIYRQCLADGSWSDDIPECEATICPPPISILKGSFEPVKEQYTYLDSVSYTCNDPKAFIKNEKSMFCTENGTWSSPPPECVAVDCPNPFVPNSKKLSGFSGPYKLNNYVRFACDNGFVMHGSSTVQCNINSMWEPSLPECRRNYCTKPKLINGNSKGTPTLFQDGTEEGYNVGDSLTMKCCTTCSLKGSRTITCGSDLKWYPALPFCEKMFGCSYPEIKNGRAILRNGIPYDPDFDGHLFSTGDTISFLCDPGFLMQGDDASKCKLGFFSYTWTPALPTCIREKNESST
ncbi:C4b-binding protein-like [Pelodytes ibericus]